MYHGNLNVFTGYGLRSRLMFNGGERKYKLWEVKFMGFMLLQKLHDVFMSTDDLEEEQNVEKDREQSFAKFKVALRSFEETEKQNCPHSSEDTVMMNYTKPMQCFTCHKYGHKSFECKTLKEQK
ncbi:hypothetical protein HELRODRAFT_169325 [Helobdella robusta]|uniref:CCHC-type domain-containing protein n=1 Tax=Helobdella robusta TaxID=6412 RepID=T1F1S2_HELRO|nr:hypothetical protein HELRODRAFT_169325 [Helobdella robusta]ESO08473.1 hypothetical protein HELRODRAFT_169325 [Helobdella robusta]